MTTAHMIAADSFLAFWRHLAHTPLAVAWESWVESTHTSAEDARQIYRLVDATLKRRAV